MKVRIKHEVLKILLEQRAVSQNRWAQILGISRGHLSLLVQGKRPYPTRRTRYKLMRGLGADFEELFQLEEEKAPRRPSGRQPPLKFPTSPGWSRGQGATSMRHYLQDLRWAWRGLAKRPAFTFLAIATLAVGIWSASAVFSFYDSLWLRPLSFHQPSRLVQITEQTARGWELSSLSDQELEYVEELRLFQSVAGYHPVGRVLTQSGDPQLMRGSSVTPSLASVLGVRPLMGRWFRESDAAQGATPVALISDRLWRSRFGARQDMVGRSIVLDDRPHQVVGIMPADFQFPLWAPPADLWLPKRMYSHGRTAHSTQVVARLMPGQTIDQARRDLRTAFGLIEEDVRHTAPNHFPLLTPLHDRVFGKQRPVLGLLMASAVCLLLVAGANFASLLLLRGTRRRSEFAIRRALGATAPRLISHQVGEGLLLALLGGAAGVALCLVSVDLFKALSPAHFPRLDQVSVDWRVVGFALAASLICGLVFGLLPGIHTVRSKRLRNPLRDLAHSPEPALARLRSMLVSGQVALAVVLLIAAGLLLRSLDALLGIDPGMNPSQVLTFTLSLDGERYSEPQTRFAFMQSVRADLRSLPGVETVSFSEGLPLIGGMIEYGFRKAEEQELGLAGKYVAGPDFFQTLRIPILAGREFSEADSKDGPQVAIINQALAEKYWESPERALGTSIVVESHPGTWQIVGIAGTVKRSQVSESPQPEMYLPYTKVTELFLRSPCVSLRTSVDAPSLIEAVRTRIGALDDSMPLIDVRLLEEVYLDSMAEPRFRSQVVAFFAILAAVLTAVGLFGLLSYYASERLYEFGIRRALGAQGLDLMKLVGCQCARTVLPGLAVGLLAGWTSARLLESFLYQVTPGDPFTFTFVPLLFLAVALVASILPARRCAQVDPASSLRAQ
ncbi:MAG TPA: ADOP family duplicated permease [Acidobacteriota bacterium]|nr:ADOP family duplicated permease [Acidobacteriota bacterium]